MSETTTIAVTGTPVVSPPKNIKVPKKPKFLTTLVAKKERNGTWTLTRPLKFYSVILGAVIVVPKGFNTDYASVPRAPLTFFLAGDTAHAEAVVHDYLYRSDDSTKASRKIADDIFLEAMTVMEVPAWRRTLMYQAVRLFGNNHYHVTVPVEEPAKPESTVELISKTKD